MEEKRIVKPWQAGLMLLVGIAVIIVGLLVMKLNNRIVLALDGVIMCLMAWCFGIPYAELQQGIKETVSSMIVAILILLAVGVLVGTWMASGTVPVMIYYGMKVLTPGLFLPVVCILCTLMSTMAGTSWGTLATVGVACMGVAQGLGVPLPAAAGAVCTGAFFGDKVSPLSDSPVITATVCEVPLMDGIRHALISTGPAYLISLVFYFVYGLRYSGGSVGGEVYEDILSTVSAEFWLSPVLLLPVLVVVVLILMMLAVLSLLRHHVHVSLKDNPLAVLHAWGSRLAHHDVTCWVLESLYASFLRPVEQVSLYFLQMSGWTRNLSQFVKVTPDFHWV